MLNIVFFWIGIFIINGKIMIVMRFFIIFVRICKFGKLVILNIILECGVFIFICRIRIMVDLKIGIVGRLIIINYEY